MKIAFDAAFLTPGQLAGRWQMHVETIRKKLRTGEIESLVLGRKRLIPIDAINRVEQASIVNATTVALK